MIAAKWLQRATLWVPGPLPNLNDIIASAKGCGGRGRGYSVMKSQWTHLVANLAKRSRVPRFERAHFEFTWREKSKLRNPDNIAAAHKFVFDGLVLAKVLDNDGWSQVSGWNDRFEVSLTPGVLVEITGVE